MIQDPIFRLGKVSCGLFTKQQHTNSNRENILAALPVSRLDPSLYLAVIIGIFTEQQLKGLDTCDQPLPVDL